MPLNFENEKRELWRLANIHMNTFNDALDKIADYAATIDEKIDSLNVADQRLKALEKQLVMLQLKPTEPTSTPERCGLRMDRETSSEGDVRKRLLALWERMTIIESGLLSNNIDDALRLTRIETKCDQRLEALENQIVMLQLKPTEPTSTPERCHIDECFNPVFIGASVTECEHCCNPTCVFHLTQLDTGVWWCVECVEATQ